jgi:hypothetical protein
MVSLSMLHWYLASRFNPHRPHIHPSTVSSTLPARVDPALIGDVKHLNLDQPVQRGVRHDKLLDLGTRGQQLVVRAGNIM